MAKVDDRSDHRKDEKALDASAFLAVMPALAPIVDAFATIVAAKLAQQLGAQNDASTYYTTDANPIGSAAHFRAFCKRRGVPVYRVGKKTLCRRDDLDAAILAQPLRAPRKAPADLDDDRALLAGAGVRLKGGTR